MSIFIISLESSDSSFYPFSCGYHYMLFPLCGLDEIQYFSFSVLIPGLDVSQLDILVLLHIHGHQLLLGQHSHALPFPFSAVTAICLRSCRNPSVILGPSSSSCSVSYHVLILPTSKIAPASWSCGSPVLLSWARYWE